MIILGINIEIIIVLVKRKLQGLIIKPVYSDIPEPKTTIKIIPVTVIYSDELLKQYTVNYCALNKGRLLNLYTLKYRDQVFE